MFRNNRGVHDRVLFLGKHLQSIGTEVNVLVSPDPGQTYQRPVNRTKGLKAQEIS